MLRGAPVNESGQFDYRKYTRMLKHGTKDYADPIPGLPATL